MNRCPCSWRALDAFTQDLTCLSARQQRAQRYFQRVRGYGNTPHVRRVQSAETTALDDIQPPPPNITSNSTTIAAARPNERADSRIERKLRRIADGNYRPRSSQTADHGTETESNGSEQGQVAAVLNRIKAMEGATPKIPKDVVATEKKMKAAQEAERPRTGGHSKKETWQIQKAALNSKFGDQGWQPRKRLSPDTMDGIRALHNSDPAIYSTPVLAEHFKISPENIRRILRSKWQPNEETKEERRQRWEKRGIRKWSEMAELGIRPPSKWRALGAGSVDRKAGEVPKWKRIDGVSTRVKRQDWEAVAQLEGETLEDDEAEAVLL